MTLLFKGPINGCTVRVMLDGAVKQEHYVRSPAEVDLVN